MTVSLIEITFYISALNPDPAMMPFISLRLIYAVQHLYFIVGAPTLFLPLGIVLVEAGFTPVEAIQIATENGALYLGQQDRIGTLASGKQADLVLIKGDPSRSVKTN
jgi:hypothetical protein